MNRPVEVQEAVKNLWNKIPVGTGADFNTVLRYVEQLEQTVEDDNW